MDRMSCKTRHTSSDFQLGPGRAMETAAIELVFWRSSHSEHNEAWACLGPAEVDGSFGSCPVVELEARPRVQTKMTQMSYIFDGS